MVDHLQGPSLATFLAEISLDPSQTNLIIFTSIIISIVLAILLLVRRRRKSIDISGQTSDPSRVQPLFSRVDVRLGDGQMVARDAYLRSLMPGRATILMQGYNVPKGLPVAIDLSSLNSEPAHALQDRRYAFGLVQGRVVRVQPLDADEKNILINVSFNDKNAVPAQLLRQEELEVGPEVRSVSTSSQLELF